MAAPDWDMKQWKKGPVTFMEALGFKSTTLHFPKVEPHLPQASGRAQHPIAVHSTTEQAFGGKPPPTGKQVGGLKQYARRELVRFRWSNQYTAFNDVVMAESGWNPHIKNPTSGAYGIAQALGHGNGSATQGTESNNYGGFGLTDKQAKAANSGNGYWQIVWMLNYIKQTYGTPDNAWAFHKSHGWY